MKHGTYGNNCKRKFGLVFNPVIQPLAFTIYPKSWLVACQSISICLLVFHLENMK